MIQKQLKEDACNAAYELMSLLKQIQDEEFINDILAAVEANDEILLAEMYADCGN